MDDLENLKVALNARIDQLDAKVDELFRLSEFGRVRDISIALNAFGALIPAWAEATVRAEKELLKLFGSEEERLKKGEAVDLKRLQPDVNRIRRAAGLPNIWEE